MGESGRVVVIGLDAADPGLIAQWADAGKLPVLGELLRSGAHGTIENHEGLYVGAVWPSFYTAVSPSRHSRYCFRQLRPGSYEIDPFHPRDVKAPPFWDLLSEQGRRVAVVDVPKTYASERINGVHIVDWGTHDPEDGLRTSPPTLANGLSRDYGVDEIRHCNAFRTTAEEFGAFRDALCDRIRRKVELCRQVMHQEPWDCFVTVFSESHCVGHQCWHLHDASHPKHDAEIRRRIGDPMEQVYVALDAAVGELLREIDPETEVLVMTSHGMGPHYDASFMLDSILQRLEGGPPPRRSKRARRLHRAWLALPQGLRALLRPVGRPVRRKMEPKDYPFRKRQAFQIPNNDVYGAIRINLAGREPHGTIRPGAEFEAYCAGLTADLLQLVNLDTGRPLVKRVLRTDDLYEGPARDYLPDLMVEWDRSAPVARVYSPRAGVIEGQYRRCRTGDHTRQGMLLVRGTATGSARDLGALSIMDIAPTIAELLAAELPDVEGHSFAPALRGRADAPRAAKASS